MGYNYITDYTSEEEKMGTFIDIGEFEKGTEEKIYWLTEDQIKRHVSKLFMLSEVNSIKQDLYIIAIKNLLKKINFLELHQQLLNSDISEEEFDNYLENESFKYTIQMDRNSSSLEKNLIVQIISKIDPVIKEFSLSDIEEMFSIKYNSLSNTFILK